MIRAVRVADPDAMRDLGARIGERARPGDVIVLDGELGAGKTTLTQGLGQALGVVEHITSPTFVIARVHQGSARSLVHVDAYRIGSPLEIDDLDLPTEDAVTVVEWGGDWFPTAVLRVRIDHAADEERIVVIDDRDGRWSDLGD